MPLDPKLGPKEAARSRFHFQDLETQADAIRDQRMLLGDPDPVPGLCDQVTKILRDALTKSQADHQAAHEAGMVMLKADDNWVQLTPEQKNGLLVASMLIKGG